MGYGSPRLLTQLELARKGIENREWMRKYELLTNTWLRAGLGDVPQGPGAKCMLGG